jgi:microcystin-dependent protein
MATYNNVLITSARYANSANTLVFVLLSDGTTWFVPPNNGSGQANVLAAWLQEGNNIGPFVPPVPGGIVPAGSLIWYASNLTPVNYLLCDGSAVKRQQYPKLFSTIGVTFGAGNGTTTFNLPDLRGKMIRGWGAVNSLDPGRNFASIQNSLLREHRHGITDPGHTHGVNDPSHLHVVNDPGHTHVGDDPGHTHAVNDPNHQHVILMYEIGYAGISIGTNDTVVTPDLNYSPTYRPYSPVVNFSDANLTVDVASANLFTATGFANVSDLLNFTNISVDPAKTNLDNTDPQGGFRTEPVNLSLLPYIRY